MSITHHAWPPTRPHECEGSRRATRVTSTRFIYGFGLLIELLAAVQAVRFYANGRNK